MDKHELTDTDLKFLLQNRLSRVSGGHQWFTTKNDSLLGASPAQALLLNAGDNVFDTVEMAFTSEFGNRWPRLAKETFSPEVFAAILERYPHTKIVPIQEA